MRRDELVGLLSKLAVGAGALLLLVVFLGSWVMIPQGTVGVVFNKMHGGVSPKVLGEGYQLKWPIVETVTEYPTSLRTYSTIGSGADPRLVSLGTNGGQHVDVQMAMTYRVNRDKAAAVFDTFKGRDIEDIEGDIIKQNVITVANNVAGKYDLSDVLGPKKGEIQQKIFEGTRDALAPFGFEVVQVNMGYIQPPPAIASALEAKMTAEQEAEKAKYALQKAEMDARSKIAEAEGIAKSNALIKAQLSDEFLRSKELDVRLEAIKKWNGKLPDQMIPGGSLPFVNLSLEKTEKK